MAEDDILALKVDLLPATAGPGHGLARPRRVPALLAPHRVRAILVPRRRAVWLWLTSEGGALRRVARQPQELDLSPNRVRGLHPAEAVPATPERLPARHNREVVLGGPSRSSEGVLLPLLSPDDGVGLGLLLEGGVHRNVESSNGDAANDGLP